VMRPPVLIPGVGTVAVMSDASGAMIGLIEPAAKHALTMTH